MQGGGVGLQLSTAADGLPLPTCVVAFDQELAGGTQPAAEPVRLVIISDTHGFEQSMTNHSAMALQSMANSRPAADPADAADADADADADAAADADADAAAAVVAAADGPAASRATGALPEGDVLIHCGDFTPGPIWPNGERVQPAEAQACTRGFGLVLGTGVGLGAPSRISLTRRVAFIPNPTRRRRASTRGWLSPLALAVYHPNLAGYHP